VITSDLDAELVMSLRAMAGAGEVPASAVRTAAGTWRPGPAGNPASYATSLPFEIARIAGGAPAGLAAALASALRVLPWIAAAEPSGAGYLTVTVTAQALAEVARRLVAAGPGSACSDVLAGTTAADLPWPDPTAAQTWEEAWTEQAAAMTGHLAATAGASITPPSGWERAASGPHADSPAQSPVVAAANYFGVDAIRYRLARTLPGQAGQLGQLGGQQADPFEAVQLAHAEAVSTLRWAAELEVDAREPGNGLATALSSAPERELLGLLSWLPERVASAARRKRPDELPRYLEQVALAWTTCRLTAPALPFGGATAPTDPAVTGARLLLADAVRTVLSAGLALTGLMPRGHI
jgi:arginyl-tRNA synthetase